MLLAGLAFPYLFYFYLKTQLSICIYIDRQHLGNREHFSPKSIVTDFCNLDSQIYQ